jgi:hypothetical protein
MDNYVKASLADNPFLVCWNAKVLRQMTSRNGPLFRKLFWTVALMSSAFCIVTFGITAQARQSEPQNISINGTRYDVRTWKVAAGGQDRSALFRLYANLPYDATVTVSVSISEDGASGLWSVQYFRRGRATRYCDAEADLVRTLAVQAGYTVDSIDISMCNRSDGAFLESRGSLSVRKVSAPPATPHAYCWATREIDNGTRRTYYFSRLWSMGRDGPTVGYQPQFQSFVSSRYSSRGGASAQCLRFFGRQEAEMRMNNLAADARRNGNDVVFTDWWPDAAPPAPNAPAERAAQAREDAAAAKAREAAAEAERTAGLNREVAERDAAIKRRNAETKAADERRQREYVQALAAQKAEVERIKREEAAAKARYEAEMAAWRARVAACNAGDYAQCQ